jgi:hypothetical protein
MQINGVARKGCNVDEHCRKVTLIARNEEEEEFLAAVVRTFVHAGRLTAKESGQKGKHLDLAGLYTCVKEA